MILSFLRRAARSAALVLAAAPVAAAEINVYTERQPELIQPVFDAFTAETGIEVNVLFASKGLVERLKAEGRRSPADLYLTADIGRIAAAIEDSTIMAVSIEDAHRHNDLSLLEAFASTTVILGVVAIAKSRVEPLEEIRDRLAQALGHIDKERLIAAPDCGLGLLGRDLTLKKLRNLSEAAHAI